MVVLKDKDNPCAFVAMRLEIYIEDNVVRKETQDVFTLCTPELAD